MSPDLSSRCRQHTNREVPSGLVNRCFGFGYAIFRLNEALCPGSPLSRRMFFIASCGYKCRTDAPLPGPMALSCLPIHINPGSLASPYVLWSLTARSKTTAGVSSSPYDRTNCR